MRRAAAAAGFIGLLAVVGVLPSFGAQPPKGTLSVSITSGPANPTTSTTGSFAFTFGGSPTSTECRESSGVGDRFTRSGGLGTAEAGGAWLASGGFATDGQRATVPAAAGATDVAALGTAWADADVSARVSLTSVPAKDQASGLVAARVSGGDSFSGRLTVLAGGQIRLQLVRSSLGVETILGTFGLGSKYAAGNVYWLRLQTSGTTIQAKGWADGKAEPGWQLSVVDATPMAGASVGFGSRGGSGLTNAVAVAVDDFMAWSTTAPATVAPCPGGSASYTALGVGGHVFRVRASASSGQVNAIYPWTVNTVAPTVSLTSTPANPTTSTDATFAWTTTGTVDSTTCTLDGSSAACTSPKSYVNLNVGQHSFSVSVSNAGGSNSASVSWTINPPAPTVSLTSTPSNSTTSTDATFAWTTTGTVDSTTCTLDGSSAACTSPKGYSSLGIGSHSFSVEVSNAGGSNSAPFSWTVNPPAPTVSLTSTPSDPTTSTDASFAWTTTGIVDSTTCTLDGSAAACTSPKAYSSLATGQHSLSVQVSNAGGSNSASFTWTINPPAPTVSLTSTPTDPTTETSATFTWTTTGTVDSTTCALAAPPGPFLSRSLGSSVTACTSPATYSDLPSGVYEFTVQVIGPGGSASATFSWRIENAPPTVRITSGPPDPTPSRWAQFTVATTGTDVAIRCLLDGSQLGFCSNYSVTLYGLDPGPHTFSVEAESPGGSASDSYSWTIEYSFMPLGVLNPPAPATSQSDPPFAFGMDTSPTMQTLDCDPNITSVSDEVVNGCEIEYAPNTFQTSPLCPSELSTATFFALPKASPFDDWPPFRCVLIKTGSTASQLVAGINQRMFGVSNNPTCPVEGTEFTPGRNYWSDANNEVDTWTFPNFDPTDPRIVRLPQVPEFTFSGSGTSVAPIVSIARFYITGWGTGLANGSVSVKDPCPGNTPPTGLAGISGGFYVWGHVLP